MTCCSPFDFFLKVSELVCLFVKCWCICGNIWYPGSIIAIGKSLAPTSLMPNNCWYRSLTHVMYNIELKSYVLFETASFSDKSIQFCAHKKNLAYHHKVPHLLGKA